VLDQPLQLLYIWISTGSADHKSGGFSCTMLQEKVSDTVPTAMKCSGESRFSSAFFSSISNEIRVSSVTHLLSSISASSKSHFNKANERGVSPALPLRKRLHFKLFGAIMKSNHYLVLVFQMLILFGNKHFRNRIAGGQRYGIV